MADIGSTLRETRIRQKIDITSVEEATKIRAKYLRALENEEWAILPGPTYVKTFLRTYAEYLGLDPRLLVEEYSARFEQPENLELPPFSREARLRPRVTSVPPPSRWGVALGGAVAIIVFLLVLGLTGGDNGKGDGNGSARSSAQKRADRRAAARRSQRAAAGTGGAAAGGKPVAGKTVRVGVVAQRDVWVCLVDAAGRTRISGHTVSGGTRAGPWRSRSFLVTFGNGGGDLVIDGHRRNTPELNHPVGYRIKPSGTEVLGQGQRPTCG